MGARVWLESTLGEGLTFHFEAPFELADKPATQPALRSALQEELFAQGLRVLVAEDNRTNLLVAQKMLGRLGCTVDVAANGKDAVEVASQRPHDLILMDMQMPEMDGLAATREIRANGEIPGHLPIIALTANAMADGKELCLQAGMNGFVSKPIKKLSLIAEINACAAAETGRRA